MTTLFLTGADLSVADVVAVARQPAEALQVALAPAAAVVVAESARAFERLAAGGRLIYGYSTGLGALDSARVRPEENRQQQANLLRSHAAGVGPAMSRAEVRAMLVCRANVLASGHSGVRPAVVDVLLGLLNHDVYPVVPETGSIGASDLAPLAHASLLVIGEGRAVVDGGEVSGAVALARAGLSPVVLEGRDAFALINGLSQSTAVGALAVSDAERLVAAAEVAVALSMVANGSLTEFLDERLARAKPHPGLVESAAQLRALTAGLSPGLSLREPLSTRCAPHVMGAAREAVARAAGTLTIELNAVVDNPTLFADGWLTSSSGNSHGQSMAEALDALATTAASVAVMSERRTARLLDPAHNGGLPAFLVHPQARAGVNSGLMIPQYTAAALVAELRRRAAPASLQSIPVSANSEDHASMSALAARHAAWAVATAETVVAVELLTAAQAVDLAGRALPAGLVGYHAALRAAVPVMVEDRVVGDDIASVVGLLRAGALVGE